MHLGFIRRLVPWVGIIASGLLGLAGGWLTLTSKSVPRPETIEHPVESSGHETPPSIESEPRISKDVWVLIDELIELGDYRRAKREWDRATESETTTDDPINRFRGAIIHEGAGDAARALQEYAKIVQSLPWSARLGEVRCLLALKRWSDASEKLMEMEERISQASPPDVEFASEVAYLRAFFELRRRGPSASDLWSPRWYDRPRWSFPGGHFLHLARREMLQPPSKPRVLAHWVSWHGPPHDEREPEPQANIHELLEQALRSHGTHPWAPQMRLEWARREADATPLRAIAIYEELLTNELPPQVATSVRCELAWAQFHRGDKRAARLTLMDAIDSGLEGPLMPWAWWLVARTHADLAEFPAATRAYRLALSRSEGVISVSAALGLATLSLLENDAPEARRILEKVKHHQLRTGPLWKEAAFLDAWSRWCLAGGSRHKLRSIREELLLTLAEWPEASATGPTGTLLRVHAHQEMGLSPLSASELERIIPDTGGQLAARLTWALALSRLHEGDEISARQCLENLVVSDDVETSARACLTLARLELQSKRPKACVQFCLQMPQTAVSTSEERFRLMGRAFEMLGDHERAADCFAGHEPYQHWIRFSR